MTEPVALFVNPVAGSKSSLAKLASPRFADARRLLGDHSLRFAHEIPESTTRKIALERWVENCLSHGTTRFAAGGGDGTVNDLLNALMRTAKKGNISPSNFSFGALALGSSCDFLKHDQKQIESRLDFDNAEPYAIGAVRLDHQEQEIFFMVNASIGLTTEANKRFNERGPLTRLLSRVHVDLAIAAVALATLLKFRSRTMTIRTNGTQHSLPVTNLGITRQKAFAGNFSYDRTPEPGKFSIFSCIDLSKWEILKTMSHLVRGHFPKSPKHLYQESNELTLSSTQPFPLELDGEIFHAKTVHIRLIEGPRVCPLK